MLRDELRTLAQQIRKGERTPYSVAHRLEELAALIPEPPAAPVEHAFVHDFTIRASVAVHVAEWIRRHGWGHEGPAVTLEQSIRSALAVYGAKGVAGIASDIRQCAPVAPVEKPDYEAAKRAVFDAGGTWTDTHGLAIDAALFWANRPVAPAREMPTSVTQEMVDAAVSAYDEHSGGFRGSILAGLEAAFKLFPAPVAEKGGEAVGVVTLTQQLADDLEYKFMGVPHSENGMPMLAALREALPERFVLADRTNELEQEAQEEHENGLELRKERDAAIARAEDAEAYANSMTAEVSSLRELHGAAVDVGNASHARADAAEKDAREARERAEKAEASVTELRNVASLHREAWARDIDTRQRDLEATKYELDAAQEKVAFMTSALDLHRINTEVNNEEVLAVRAQLAELRAGVEVACTREELSLNDVARAVGVAADEYEEGRGIGYGRDGYIAQAMLKLFAERPAPSAATRWLAALPAKWRKEVAGSDPEDAETIEDRGHVAGFCDALTFAAGDLERVLSGITITQAALDTLHSPSTPVAPVQERPAVGSVVAWDVARADMEKHEWARYRSEQLLPYCMRERRLMVLYPDSEPMISWKEFSQAASQDWIRLPDADAPAPAQASEADGPTPLVVALRSLLFATASLRHPDGYRLLDQKTFDACSERIEKFGKGGV